ncbi:twin-arginine translocase subunit TatC [Crossiella sp. S99.2]|uniref:twin-arginine translocase subunit TatC n=1 Tax=unclassified Crossiella TaxID=2620835 RepID=UPI0035ABE35A
MGSGELRRRKGLGKLFGRREKNPDGTMTLIEHLYELRHRLAVSLLALVAGAVIAFLWWVYTVGPIPTLGSIVLDPYCAIPDRVSLNAGKCQLLQTQPFEAFMVRLKVSLAVGAVLAAPVWLYQLWSFITPGLYQKEKRYAGTFVSCASALFMLGAVLAFFIIPKALIALVGFGGEEFATALAGSNYINFVLALLIIFGVSFELPLLVVMLNFAGVLSYDKLRRSRRGAIFGLFVFAAIATPGTDPFSMLALALALTLLHELSIQIARIRDKRAARKRGAEGWDSWNDDDASPIAPDTQAEEVEPVRASPAPVVDKPRVRYDDDAT